MPPDLSNRDVTTALRLVADLLEIRGESVFKLAAYRRAAESIGQLTETLQSLRSRGELERIPGVGKAIAQKIEDLLDTGSFKLLDELTAEIPPGVAQLLTVPDIGPKRARQLHQDLGIDSLDALRLAAADGRLHEVPGLGPRGANRIVEALRSLQPESERLALGVARPLAYELVHLLQEARPELHSVKIAGSVRRFAETVGDIDLVIATNDPQTALDAWTQLPIVATVLDRSDTSCRVLLQNGFPAELHIGTEANFGSLLQFYTGSRAHNAQLARLAEQRGMKLTELGFVQEERIHRCASEQEVYAFLELQYVPPPMREDRGEVELALQHRLPPAFDVKLLKGDLHTHTVWSDGSRSVLDMAYAARERGYEYICITDHSQSLGVANGLSPERLAQQRLEIDAANDQMAPFRVLQGVELEVKGDGSMDLPTEALARLDMVIASVHSGLRKGREQVTSRALAAIRHPLIDVLAHPTGRLVGGRAGGDFDMEALYAEAARTGTTLEINADPARLDLRDTHAAAAVKAGCTLSIGSDAHAAEGLGNAFYGAAIATRARLETRHVLNTLPLQDLLARLKRNHP